MHKRYYNWLRELSISAPMCVAESGPSDAPSQHRGTRMQFWLGFSGRPITVRLFMSLRSHSLPPLSRAKQCTCGIKKENSFETDLFLKMEENDYGNPKVWDHERRGFFMSLSPIILSAWQFEWNVSGNLYFVDSSSWAAGTEASRDHLVLQWGRNADLSHDQCHKFSYLITYLGTVENLNFIIFTAC